MSNGYGNKSPLRSCGFRHAYCRVCRPDLDFSNRHAPRYSGQSIAVSSVPFPEKTVWERHAEEYDVKEAEVRPIMDKQHIYIGDLLPRKPYAIPKPNRSFEQVLEEIKVTGRKFTYKELREHFGFTIAMARRFQNDKREKKREYNAEREKRIIEMRLTPGTTLKMIAEKEDVTRERIRQILLAAEKRHGIQLPRGHEKKPPVLLVIVRCAVCRKPKEVSEDKKNKWHNKFCSDHHMSPYGFKAWEKTGFEWWRESSTAKARWRYHNDDRVRATNRASTLAWVQKIKKDPIKLARYKKMQDEAAARYAHKMKEKNKPKPRPFIEVESNDD